MQERWKLIARAAAEAVFDTRAGRDDTRRIQLAEHSGGFATVQVRSPIQIDVDRFRTLRTQRQISTYLLHRSLSADQRNHHGLESWREALRRSQAELAGKQKD
jgi:hypothetical protein